MIAEHHLQDAALQKLRPPCLGWRWRGKRKIRFPRRTLGNDRKHSRPHVLRCNYGKLVLRRRGRAKIEALLNGELFSRNATELTLTLPWMRKNAAAKEARTLLYREKPNAEG
jgi:hypothetical protein